MTKKQMRWKNGNWGKASKVNKDFFKKQKHKEKKRKTKTMTKLYWLEKNGKTDEKQ